MANFKPHICGKSDVYIPNAGCSDCDRLEARVKALEDIVAKKITLSQTNKGGASITAEVLGEVVN